MDALRSFRWHLPMDLLVWYRSAPSKRQRGPAHSSKSGAQEAAASCAAAQQGQGHEQQQQAEEAQNAGQSGRLRQEGHAVTHVRGRREDAHSSSEQEGPGSDHASSGAQELNAKPQLDLEEDACTVELAGLLGDGVL